MLVLSSPIAARGLVPIGRGTRSGEGASASRRLPTTAHWSVSTRFTCAAPAPAPVQGQTQGVPRPTLASIFVDDPRID